jgi:hypothetical protein
MITMTTAKSNKRATMLGHLFRRIDRFVPEAPLRERNSDVLAGVWTISSSSSLLSALASSGVCSVDLFEGIERAEREDRADFWEAGRESMVVRGVKGATRGIWVGVAACVWDVEAGNKGRGSVEER